MIVDTLKDGVFINTDYIVSVAKEGKSDNGEYIYRAKMTNGEEHLIEFESMRLSWNEIKALYPADPDDCVLTKVKSFRNGETNFYTEKVDFWALTAIGDVRPVIKGSEGAFMNEEPNTIILTKDTRKWLSPEEAAEKLREAGY